MSDLRLVVLLVMPLVAAGAAAPAAGQQHELTVLGGVRTGGELEDAATGATRPFDEGASLGLSIGFLLGGDRTLEVVWTHQEVHVPPPPDGGADIDLRLDTVGVGGTYEWGAGKVRPFVSATGGLTLLSPQAAGYDLELLLTGTLGGGVKVPLSARAGLRLEGRGVAMFATSSAAGVCGGGGCALYFSGAGIGQLELLAGLSFAF